MPKYTITVTFHPETFEFDTDDHPEAFAPQGDELEAVLKAAGARKGQEVEIGEETLEWQ